jgi:hypothetical protein
MECSHTMRSGRDEPLVPIIENLAEGKPLAVTHIFSGVVFVPEGWPRLARGFNVWCELDVPGGQSSGPTGQENLAQGLPWARIWHPGLKSAS